MEATTYVGEHAWAGHLGHLLAVVSFSGALLSTLSFLLATRSGSVAWRSLGRIAFRAHSAAVVGIVVTLFVMLLNHWFEFDYVWKHSNREMPLRYILSCFWEGQEGSFLLWTFWHMVVGNILIARSKEWETPVMTVVSLVQVFLATMLLGVYLFGIRVGSSPFLLIRDLPENIGLPWTQIGDYLTRIPQFTDGRGLNPLLQNYWMVIHPPTLFLGFACTLVPFAYAIAGLWQRRYKEWMAPALPWTFLGIMVLGTGILMGGAWAYEALSFGGFWAWDPVENASLVPWLTLVGTGHLLLINKRKETSLFTAFFLALTTFLLVLYSGFLTRSGVLGDTSVHSFTGEGMLPGLLIFLLTFIALSTAMLNSDSGHRRFYLVMCALMLILGVALHVQVAAILLFAVTSIGMAVVAYRTGPFHGTEEEHLMSREFWLFIASLVLLLSAAQITFTTSQPVFNLIAAPLGKPLTWLADLTGSDYLHKLAIGKLAPPAEPKAHYNKWQIPFAFIVAMLGSFGQYLRYKDTDRRKFFRELMVSFILGVVITALLVWLLEYRFTEANLIALLFASIFAAVANANYFFRVLKGSLKNAGPSVAHVGFSLVLLGALISNSRQREVSRNVQGMDLRFLNEGFNNNTDLLMYRGDTLRMGEHYVCYTGKEIAADSINLFFRTRYFEVVPKTYSAGDTVRVHSSLFVARDAHTAGPDFLKDQPHWQELADFTRAQRWHARTWSATRPGKELFDLRPLVQLNPRFGNVAEPSTKHWAERDLYTHIRYADLNKPTAKGDSAGGSGIRYMPARLYEKQVGDSIVTPTSIILVDSIRIVRDSVTTRLLGPEGEVKVVHMRVRDLYDVDRWFEAKPIAIFRGGVLVGSKGFELPALRERFDVASIQGNSIGLNVSDQEFIVLQAIVFPGINILWIGCIIMALGSFLAIRARVKRS